MTSGLLFIIIVIVFALIFDFLNGFHDAANSIATVVSTRVLKPHTAVAWAAFFNFIAFLFFNLHVANTIGTGLVNPALVDAFFIFTTLCAAIFWNIVTWYYGLPSSSSHALIGGLIGPAIAKGGLTSLNVAGITKVLSSIILSPAIGFFLGILLMVVIARIFFNRPRYKTEKLFRKLQLLSAALISLGHGGNDAQKTMGIIAILLFSANLLGDTFYVPVWVVIACNFVMALGTWLGGWRIVKTMGMKITKLKPVHGCAAETAAAITLFLATELGIPISTTHTITGAITGVGSSYRFSAVRWGVAHRIVWAWIITIPATALLSGGLWAVVNYFS